MMTLDTTTADLEEAQGAYDVALDRHREASSGTLTPKRVLDQIELRHELEQAARTVEQAREAHARAAAKQADERRAKAQKQLTEAESEMADKAARAEELMDELVPLLLDLDVTGKRRYGLRAEVTGRPEHGLIPTNLIVGWLRHRLAGLESPDLGRAHRHQRGSLADLLALTPSAIDSEDVPK